MDTLNFNVWKINVAINDSDKSLPTKYAPANKSTNCEIGCWIISLCI